HTHPFEDRLPGIALVLPELALLDLLFPAAPVPFDPRAAAELRRKRRVVPGLAVALALVALLRLLLDNLFALPACGQAECENKDRQEQPHDFLAGAGGWAPGWPGP